jgi:hypothetical protein
VSNRWRLLKDEPPFIERADKLGKSQLLADCALEVENLALRLRMISKNSAYPATDSPVQVVVVTGSEV